MNMKISQFKWLSNIIPVWTLFSPRGRPPLIKKEIMCKDRKLDQLITSVNNVNSL